MRLKKIKNAGNIIKNSKYFINSPYEIEGNWDKEFGNDNDIELEIGMGKGDFLLSKCINNPNINYIGLEKYDSVLVSAIKKLESFEVKNIRIINDDANNLLNIFDNEINKIYLNFSDPWPKRKHEKRRLTNEYYLGIYDKIFKKDVNIEMKTDNDDLFAYSVESFKNYGYIIKEIDRNIDDFYKTEYEVKFRNRGKNINFVSVYKSANK